MKAAIRNLCFAFLLYGKFYKNSYRISYSDGISVMEIQVAGLVQRQYSPFHVCLWHGQPLRGVAVLACETECLEHCL